MRADILLSVNIHQKIVNSDHVVWRSGSGAITDGAFTRNRSCDHQCYNLLLKSHLSCLRILTILTIFSVISSAVLHAKWHSRCLEVRLLCSAQRRTHSNYTFNMCSQSIAPKSGCIACDSIHLSPGGRVNTLTARTLIIH